MNLHYASVMCRGVGKNRNFSYMSKENIQRCLPTLSYAPVVGHLIDKLDEDGNQLVKSTWVVMITILMMIGT